MSKTGGWSKYGGARIQISESQYGLEQVGDKWFCQSCGEEMPKDLPPYRVEFLPGEYFRVCSTCLNKKV